MYLLYSISLFHFYYKLLIKKIKQDRRKTLCSRQWSRQLVRKFLACDKLELTFPSLEDMAIHHKKFNFIFCAHFGPLLSLFNYLGIINAYCINSCIDSFPLVCQKRPVAVTNIFVTTCYIKFRWFQFLRREEETKWPQYFQCSIVCTALVSSPGYKATHPPPNNIATVRFVCTKLHNVPATCS